MMKSLRFFDKGAWRTALHVCEQFVMDGGFYAGLIPGLLSRGVDACDRDFLRARQPFSKPKVVSYCLREFAPLLMPGTVDL
jgi:hypothetical protein